METKSKTKGEEMDEVTRLKGYLPLLKDIDRAIDRLEEYDRDFNRSCYGDMAQNFENAERERLTVRLRKMIKQAIKGKR